MLSEIKLDPGDRLRVFKLQRPLLSNDPNVLGAAGHQAVLAYDREQQERAYVPMTNAMVRHLFGDRPKVYARARFIPDPGGEGRKLEIVALLPSTQEPDW